MSSDRKSAKWYTYDEIPVERAFVPLAYNQKPRIGGNMASSETPFGKDTVWSVAMVYGDNSIVLAVTVVAECRDVAVLKASDYLDDKARKTINLVVAHPF